MNSNTHWTNENSHLMPHTMGKRPMFGTSSFPDNFSFRVSYRTELDALMEILPPGMVPVGEPVISFIYRHSEKVDWVPGGEFNALGAQINVIFKGKEGEVEGSYPPVVWENDPMAVILGREIFGVPKLCADITNPISMDGGWRGLLSEGGLPLIEVKISNLVPILGKKLDAARAIAKTRKIFGWKQFPTIDMRGVELGYATCYPGPSGIDEAWSCDGEVVLFETDADIHVWTHSIMGKLRGIPLLECLGGTLITGPSELQLANSWIMR